MSATQFKPQPGQIDYTNVRRAPVVNCLVQHGDQILIVRRSDQLNFYPGLWNGISGFLDDGRPVAQKARQELAEELGLAANVIISIREGRVFEVEEPRYDKVWLVHPALAVVTTNQLRLDWEAQEHRWVSPGEVGSFSLVPGFARVVQTFFGQV